MKIRRLMPYLMIGSLLLFFAGKVALTQNDVPTCYELEVGSPMDEPSVTTQIETWCYQRLNNPQGAVFIFNGDTNEVRPELSLILEQNGQLTHASLLRGKLTIHRLWADQFNPYSIPLEEPRHLRPLGQKPYDSVDEVLQFLINETETSLQVIDLEVVSGVHRASIPSSAKPWRGFWWPRKGHPMAGSTNSPLAKYDQYVRARVGSSPGARTWENSRHRYKGVSWEGHCNGWVASSVLRKQPSNAKFDPLSKVTFSVSDQKGLLAEMDYCVAVAFFGKRYRGSGHDIKDIDPSTFHKTLTYYIGQLKKPVSIDYMRTSPVDNHIISGYNMNIQSLGQNRYSVITKLTVHKYDKFRTNKPAIAPTYTRTYSYTLTTNGSGVPIGGVWRSINPDFLWVPLAIKDCDSNNPHVEERWIQSIIFN